MSGWSDYGDWTSKDSLKLSIDPLEAMRQALIEHCIGGNWFNKNYPQPFTTKNFAFTRPIDFFISFDGFLASNWTKFINYTYNDGNFDSLPGMAPAFTLETLLACIGDDALIPTPQKLSGSLDWIWQRYKILNAMKWSYYALPYGSQGAYFAAMRRYVGSSYWNQVAYIPGDTIFYYGNVYNLKPNGFIFAICFDTQYNIIQRNLTPAVDVYYKLSRYLTIADDPNAIPDFPGFVENIYRKFLIDGIPSAIGSGFGSNVGVMGSTNILPDIFVNNDANYAGKAPAYLANTYEIMRYDVPGGFQFIAGS